MLRLNNTETNRNKQKKFTRALFHCLLGNLKKPIPSPFHCNSESFFPQSTNPTGKHTQKTRTRRTWHNVGTSHLNWKSKWWPCLSTCVGFQVHSKGASTELKAQRVDSTWYLRSPLAINVKMPTCHTFLYCRVRPLLQILFGIQSNPVVKWLWHIWELRHFWRAATETPLRVRPQTRSRWRAFEELCSGIPFQKTEVVL